jgi:hypothetical protein
MQKGGRSGCSALSLSFSAAKWPCTNPRDGRHWACPSGSHV